MPNKKEEEFVFTTTTEKNELTSIMDYESVDLLNRLPFSQSPLIEYIADFDDSVEMEAVDANFYNADGK